MHQLLQPECRRCFSAPNFVNASNGTTHIHGWSRKVGCKFLANVGFKGKDAGRVSGGGPRRGGILVTYPSPVPRSILLPPFGRNLEKVDRPLSQFSFEHVNIVISEQEYSNLRKTWIWKFCDFDRNCGKIYSCPLLPKTIFARIASLTPAGCCSRPAAAKCSSRQALTPDPSPGRW